MQLNWNEGDGYLEGTTKDFKLKNKVASFDLDGTIITTKSGKKFPIDENDWVFLYSNTVDKIKEFIKNDFCIIIVSNQAGIEIFPRNKKIWKTKMEHITNKFIEEIGDTFQIKILCSTSKNKYRKPSPLFYYEFFPKNPSTDSFYCGDASGRIGDHDITDYKFALNCLLDFYTPEMLFLGKKEELPKIKYANIFKQKKEEFNFKPQSKEMILLVGYQGSGKSYLSNILKTKYDYVIVNNDTLKLKSVINKVIYEAINNDKSIVIDNTNPSKEVRKYYIHIAQKNNYKVRCIKLKTSYMLSKHNNAYRMIKGGRLVPDVGYNMFKKNYSEPKKEEGIDEIIEYHPAYPIDIIYSNYLF